MATRSAARERRESSARRTGRVKPASAGRAESVARQHVLAFRLQRLGLTKRARDVESAMDAVGWPDFPPGAALDAAASRLASPAPDVLEAAFEARTLVRMRAMRGAPVVVHTADYDSFIAGVLPPDEASMRTFLGAAMHSVKAAELSALDAVALASDHTSRALARGPLDRDQLHAELRRSLPKGLLPYCRPCGSHHAHFSLLYAVALSARLVLFPRDDGPYRLERFDAWQRSGKRKASIARPEALLRRFLAAYAPAAPPDFASWAGIAASQARAAWDSLSNELRPVQVEGGSRAAFVLEDDLAALRAARSDGSTVRLIAPGDPLLQARDRGTLLPEHAAQQIVWKNLAPRGLVLTGTDVAAIARIQKQRNTLRITLDATGRVAAPVRNALEAEAEFLARARGCREAQVVWS